MADGRIWHEDGEWSVEKDVPDSALEGCSQSSISCCHELGLSAIYLVSLFEFSE